MIYMSRSLTSQRTSLMMKQTWQPSRCHDSVALIFLASFLDGRLNFLDLATMKILMRRPGLTVLQRNGCSKFNFFVGSRFSQLFIFVGSKFSLQKVESLSSGSEAEEEKKVGPSSSFWHVLANLCSSFAQDDGRVGGLFKSLTRNVKNLTGGAVLTEADLEFGDPEIGRRPLERTFGATGLGLF